MNRGFNIILAAQFFSSLADNALLFAAIALLKSLDAPSWQTPVLQQFFVFSFIALAPFVGAFSDALPKGQVMFISNGIKIAGCAAMLLGLHPLLAYGFVGIGAALFAGQIWHPDRMSAGPQISMGKRLDGRFDRCSHHFGRHIRRLIDRSSC